MSLIPYDDDLFSFPDIFGSQKMFRNPIKVDIVEKKDCFEVFADIPEAVNAQIEAGLVSHRHFFGSHPDGFYLPYLGYCDKTDPLYQNTRRFILSAENPFYFSGAAAHGVGSPHTGKDKIWHIALIMQILTATDADEIADCLAMLSRTHADTNFMHESFNKDDPADFTRKWFAWANSLFAQMLIQQFMKE